MNDFEELGVTACNTQKQAINLILEAQELKEKIMNNNDTKLEKGIELSNIPFSAYEMQQDRNAEEKKQIFERHENEKEKIRKHYGKIVTCISIILAIFIIAVSGTVIWFLDNYDIFTGYVQEINTEGDNADATIEDGIHINDTSSKENK